MAAEAAESLANKLKESVCFALIEDLLTARKISSTDAEFLRKKYTSLYENVVKSQNREEEQAKRCRAISNEILSEKIAVEKGKFEESQMQRSVRSLEAERDTLQAEHDLSEQRDNIAKFEIAELKKLHDDLNQSLKDMKKQNKSLVEPVIESLTQQISEINEQYDFMDEAHSKEEAEKASILARIHELEESVKKKKSYYDEELTDRLKKAKQEPERLARKIDTVQSAIKSMEDELKGIQGQIKRKDNQAEKLLKRKEESEKLKAHLESQQALKRQTIEQREQDIAILKTKLQHEKARNNELITSKVESTIKSKEADSLMRHKTDQLSFVTKEYEGLKRKCKKKIGLIDSSKTLLPQLESLLKEVEASVAGQKSMVKDLEEKVSRLKDEADIGKNRLMQQLDVESSAKQQVEELTVSVEDLEADVGRLAVEDHRLTKVISLLSTQRDLKAIDVQRLIQKHKDAAQHLRMKELMIVDLTKRCNEISNRVKEFSALHEVVKNERNKQFSLIAGSAQAISEMREKVRVLGVEITILRGESAGKDRGLVKERAAFKTVESQRDILRNEVNIALSAYRQKQSTVELQIQDIDKLNLVINNLEHEMLELKSLYEKAVNDRNVSGVRLIDKNDELCVLNERWKLQKDVLAKAEAELIRQEDEMRFLRLQHEELSRQYKAVNFHLPQVVALRSQLARLEEELLAERRVADAEGCKLEDTANMERYRELLGEDPDMDQLTAKMNVLDARINGKREQQLEKEVVLEELTELTETLRSKGLERRDKAKSQADQLNTLQTRIREATKKMLATVSELSMYQATALRLQNEKSVREKELEDATWRVDHGEAPNEEALVDFEKSERRRQHQTEVLAKTKSDYSQSMQGPVDMMKTTAEPRPTAYVPDNTIMPIPRPYGNHAPFKPSELGATMRHIRQPIPKVIEL